MQRIIIDPNVCNGQPVVKGTRITARTILEFLGAGDTIEEVLAEYPALTREDVLACISFSSDLLRHHYSRFEVGCKTKKLTTSLLGQ